MFALTSEHRKILNKIIMNPDINKKTLICISILLQNNRVNVNLKNELFNNKSLHINCDYNHATKYIEMLIYQSQCTLLLFSAVVDFVLLPKHNVTYIYVQ